ncbi:MAG: hypothetical protein IIX14_05500 [Clostridia bacterium]|nr:hypothetical protein [Clostridia bacterium]
MGNDVIFKSKAFGGFDKAEVMNYVNKMLEEKAELEKKLSESNANYARVNAQLFEMKAAVEYYDECKAELEASNEKISSLEEESAKKTALIEGLEKDIEILKNENVALESKNSQLSAPWEREAELEDLKAEVVRLRLEAEKKKDLERQVGAAMLDARIHSEELVEEAKEKANAVTKSVYSAIGETAVRIDDLSAGITDIARGFTKAVEEVELRIKALTGDMSKTAQLLISESSAIIEEDSIQNKSQEETVEYDFSATVENTSTTINPVDYGVENVAVIDITDEQIDNE